MAEGGGGYMHRGLQSSQPASTLAKPQDGLAPPLRLHHSTHALPPALPASTLTSRSRRSSPRCLNAARMRVGVSASVHHGRDGGSE